MPTSKTARSQTLQAQSAVLKSALMTCLIASTRAAPPSWRGRLAATVAVTTAAVEKNAGATGARTSAIMPRAVAYTDAERRQSQRQSFCDLATTTPLGYNRLPQYRENSTTAVAAAPPTTVTTTTTAQNVTARALEMVSGSQAITDEEFVT